MGKNIKAGKGTFRLEDMVKPEAFFDLTSFSSGRIGSKQARVTISHKHMYLADRLRESGLFRISTSHMNRGLLILGLVADCLYNNICQKKAVNIIKQSKGCRQKHNAKEINTATSYLDKNDETENMLFNNFIKYGDSLYGGNILGFMPTYINKIPRPHKAKKVVIPLQLENLCKSFSQTPPTSDKYKISRKVKNEKFLIWTPNHIKIMSFALMKSSIIHTRLISDIYRGGFVTGLYIMCRWVIENRMSVDEYYLCKILHNIYDYLSDCE